MSRNDDLATIEALQQEISRLKGNHKSCQKALNVSQKAVKTHFAEITRLKSSLGREAVQKTIRENKKLRKALTECRNYIDNMAPDEIEFIDTLDELITNQPDASKIPSVDDQKKLNKSINQKQE